MKANPDRRNLNKRCPKCKKIRRWDSKKIQNIEKVIGSSLWNCVVDGMRVCWLCYLRVQKCGNCIHDAKCKLHFGEEYKDNEFCLWIKKRKDAK